MLKEEQVAELLARHKNIVSAHLDMIRGNLRNAESRASQVWELVVLDAAARVGQVEYEPHPGASPDIKLLLLGSRPIWIEVAYLYPRFWQEDRKADAAVRWIFSEAERLGIPPSKILPRIEGRKRTAAGRKVELPDQHKKKEFLREPELVAFFEQIRANPGGSHVCSLSDYSMSIEYRPHAQGPFVSWHGCAQEDPKTVEEHALYRVLEKKLDQHDVAGPHVVCVGSDVSPALSSIRSPDSISVADAVAAICTKHRSLSCAIVVYIRTMTKPGPGFDRRAQKQTYENLRARDPLTPEEFSLLDRIDFNHWKYTFSLPKRELPGSAGSGCVAGNLTSRLGQRGNIVEVPAHIVIDALAGKASLENAYGFKDDDYPLRMFREGWTVVSCAFKEGNLEAGESPTIVFELVSPSVPEKELSGSSKNGRIGGDLTWRHGPRGDIVEVPAHIVIEALAGKESLDDAYRSEDKDFTLRMFREGWTMISCDFKQGNLEAREASKMVFELISPDTPFWPTKHSGTKVEKK